MSFRATSAMPENTTLVFELPAATHSTSAVSMGLMVTVCPTDADRAAKASSCVSANITAAVSRGVSLGNGLGVIKLTMTLPIGTSVDYDQVVDLFNIGATSSGFLHRSTSGPFGLYRLYAFVGVSALDNSTGIEPEYCYAGNLHPYVLQENVAYPLSNKLVISHKQVGAVSSLFFTGFTLAIPLVPDALVRVYFPPDFDLENITLTGPGFVIDQGSVFSAPAAAPILTPPATMDTVDRPAVQIRVTTGTSLSFTLNKIRNPYYALGYPPDLYSAPPLLIRTVAVSGSAMESIIYPVVIVPVTLDDFTLRQIDRSAASVVAVEFTFALSQIFTVASELHIRLPAGVLADRPSGGFQVTSEVGVLLSENAYIGGGGFAVANRTADVSSVSSWFAAPFMCSKGNSYCSDANDGRAQSSTCAEAGSLCVSAPSVYAQTYLVLTRTTRVVQGVFFVPSNQNATHGYTCAVTQQPVSQLPGALVQPAGCPIDGSVFNTSASLDYIESPQDVGAARILKFVLTGLRNPVRYGEVPGNFDVEIWNPRPDGGRRLIARQHNVASLNMTTGDITVSALALTDLSVGGTSMMTVSLLHAGLLASGNNISLQVLSNFAATASIAASITVVCPVVDCSSVVTHASIVLGSAGGYHTIEVSLGNVTAGAWMDSNVQISVVNAVTSRSASGATMSSSRAASYSVDIDPRLGAAAPIVEILPDKSGAEVQIRATFTPSTVVPAVKP
ncbi:hypothetical protein T484DRAFT_1803204 [Baffinella frigidus]|nr:hypothetical protein T484DRAFT_1803204 [Cryptophyta sp. CCMP2293]